MKSNYNASRSTEKGKTRRALTEAAALLRAPQRAIPLVTKIASDKWRTTFEPRHLYSYASTIIPTECALRLLIDWILNAQRPDGGVAAYYSLLTGYSDSYPEVTGYIIPTLYDFSTTTGDPLTGCSRCKCHLERFPQDSTLRRAILNPPHSIQAKFCKAWFAHTAKPAAKPKKQKSWNAPNGRAPG